MKEVKKESFKGKKYNYSTYITTTKLEYFLAWFLGLTIIIGIFLIILFANSFLVALIFIFGLIILFILLSIAIIFNKKHKEERIENSNVYKE